MNIDFSAIIPKVNYFVIETELTNYPVVVAKDDGYYHATFNGNVFRVCSDDYCYNAFFPSKESAEIFINVPVMYEGLGFTNTKGGAII